jgi:hypothetical protein
MGAAKCFSGIKKGELVVRKIKDKCIRYRALKFKYKLQVFEEVLKTNQMIR